MAVRPGYAKPMSEYEHDLSDLRIETPPMTLRAMALERLQQAIISGVFKPGQRLVERTLCEQLGVSRSVIREVIRHLDAEGLVTTEGQGPMVARLTSDDARQIYEIRAALEAAAVEACARVADDAVKATLQTAVEAIERHAAESDWMAVLAGHRAILRNHLRHRRTPDRGGDRPPPQRPHRATPRAHV